MWRQMSASLCVCRERERERLKVAAQLTNLLSSPLSSPFTLSVSSCTAANESLVGTLGRREKRNMTRVKKNGEKKLQLLCNLRRRMDDDPLSLPLSWLLTSQRGSAGTTVHFDCIEWAASSRAYKREIYCAQYMHEERIGWQETKVEWKLSWVKEMTSTEGTRQPSWHLHSPVSKWFHRAFAALLFSLFHSPLSVYVISSWIHHQKHNRLEEKSSKSRATRLPFPRTLYPSSSILSILLSPSFLQLSRVRH